MSAQSTQAEGMEIEKGFLVINGEWRAAVENVAYIKQHYLQDITEGGVFLRIMAAGPTATTIAAIHPRQGLIWDMPIPEESLRKFGPQNLRFITRQDGIVPISDELSARVRLKGSAFLLTIKASTEHVDARRELEFSISTPYAERLIPHCPYAVEKNRNIVMAHGNKWEIDVFLGDNKGLTKAEIELPHRGATFIKPSWLGREVTADLRYTNLALAKHPYNRWSALG